MATISGFVFDGGGACSTFFELGFIVLTELAGSFALDADLVAVGPSFLAAETGFAGGAASFGFLESFTAATDFVVFVDLTLDEGALDFCVSLSALAASGLAFAAEPFAAADFAFATGAGFFATAIFFVSFASLEAAF